MSKGNKAQAGLLLTLISIPIFIGALDLTVVSAVLPHVILDLEIPIQTGLDDAAWMVTGYLLAYSISMTFMGRLSDLYGRRQVYLIALVVFAFGSYLVAVADTWPTQLALRTYYMLFPGRPDVSFVTLYAMIAARMIQAFGAGTMVPVGMAMVGDIFGVGNRARALGIIAAVDTAGWVVGHLYGGIVVRFWDWRMIFLINLPICAVAFVFIWYKLRKVPQEKSKGNMDWLGTLLIAGSLTMLNIGLGSTSEGSTGSSLESQTGLPENAVPLLIGSGVFLLLFLWWQNRAKYPLVDLSLFKLKNYLPASVANFLVGFSLFVAIANVPLFINSLIATTLVQGAWDSGWMLSALTVPMAIASILGGWLSDKRGYRFPATVGLIVAVFGFILMTSWTAETSYTTMALHLLFCGIGLGLTMAPIAAAIVNTSPSDQRGTSSALVIIFRLIGMTIGISSITTYGLRRAEVISKQLLSIAPDINEISQIAVEVTERVIRETFIIAGIVAAIAILPTIFLKNQNKGDLKNVREHN
ncbi:MAG: MFS transporter [Chloroflexi bacterium]|nr:MFS transporter [Chloroflexota bacterium]